MVVIMLLNVMEVFSVSGGALLIDRVRSSKEYAYCACVPSVHPSAPSICFVCMAV